MSNFNSGSSVAIGFPGQGPHEPDKFKRLVRNYPRALETIIEAEETLNRPLLPLLLRERAPDSSTRDNQVRLYLGSSALWLTAEAEGVIPPSTRQVYFGASAGEYAALMAAGAYDFATGLQQIDIRGEQMGRASEINPGRMLIASGLPFDEAEKIATEFNGVYAVNDNPGSQTVFSGSEVGLKEITAYLGSSETWSHVRLDWAAISEAAHSIHMAPAVEGVKNALKTAKMRSPRHEFIGNRAKPIRSAKAVANHLAEQLTRGVLLRQSAQLMRDQYNVQTFVDVGPGKVLYGQFKREFRKTVELVSVMDELLPE